MEDNMIELKDVDLKRFVQKVYEMSKPQGLGFFVAQSGGLSDEEAGEILARDLAGRVAASMDYVHGRACKMTVFREDGKYYIRDAWYDHSAAQLSLLLSEFGLSLPEKERPAGWGTAA